MPRERGAVRTDRVGIEQEEEEEQGVYLHKTKLQISGMKLQASHAERTRHTLG